MPRHARTKFLVRRPQRPKADPIGMRCRIKLFMRRLGTTYSNSCGNKMPQNNFLRYFRLGRSIRQGFPIVLLQVDSHAIFHSSSVNHNCILNYRMKYLYGNYLPHEMNCVAATRRNINFVWYPCEIEKAKEPIRSRGTRIANNNRAAPQWHRIHQQDI